MTYDGNNVQVIVAGNGMNQPKGLAFFSQNLFYVDTAYEKLFKGRMYSSTNLTGTDSVGMANSFKVARDKAPELLNIKIYNRRPRNFFLKKSQNLSTILLLF